MVLCMFTLSNLDESTWNEFRNGFSCRAQLNIIHIFQFEGLGSTEWVYNSTKIPDTFSRLVSLSLCLTIVSLGLTSL